MSVAIAGGGLQGLEVTYLAGKAGFATLLLDKTNDAPATGICHRFACIDLTDHGALGEALNSVDLVIPATENPAALQSLVEWCGGTGIPLAFDPGAYAVSSSKSVSDALFRSLGIPAPTPWPDCEFPVLAKPDGMSGSKGVEVFDDLLAIEARFDVLPPPGHVLQSYLAGPSYSVEIIGRPGNYTPFQTTRLQMDRGFGCKRVLAPCSLSPEFEVQFETMAVALAEALELKGIMDVECILHDGELKVLEIDARFPSQTPTAVYHSTGINMVERLVRVFLDPGPNDPVSASSFRPGGSVLEHIKVRDGRLSVCGEQVMSGEGPLRLEVDFFGAEEALTNFDPGRADWVATLMVKGTDLREAMGRRHRVIHKIRNRLGLDSISDETPQELKEPLR